MSGTWPQLGLVALSIAALLFVMALIRRQAVRHGYSAELQRKLVHMTTGCFAMSLPWLFAESWPVYLLLGASLVVMLLLRASGGELSRTVHGVERASRGDLLLLLAVLFVYILSAGEPVLYLLPLAVLTLSDAAAALAGTHYGRHRFRIEGGQKSLEGSAIFLLVTLLVAMSCLVLLTELDGPDIIVLTLAVGIFGTLIESDSWQGFDNLFLPAGTLLLLRAHLDSDPLVLALTLGGFLLLLALMLRQVAKGDLEKHLLRSYASVVFLLLTAIGPLNAVLPISTLLIHRVLVKRCGDRAPFPQLDMIAALVLLSLGWLMLGHGLARNTIWFYEMHCLSLAALWWGLATTHDRPVPRWSLAAFVFAVLLCLWHALMSLNPPEAQWPLPVSAWGLLAVLVALTLAERCPRFFEQGRRFKASTLSAAVPMAAFVARTLA